MASVRTLNKYKKLLRESPYNRRSIPFEKLTEEECISLLQISGECLECIPLNKRTKEMILCAVESSPKTLSSIPESKRTKKLCMAAYKTSSGAFAYFPKKYRSLELAIDCYKRFLKNPDPYISVSSVAYSLPAEYHDDDRIFKLERQLNIRRITSKKYFEGKFYVTEYINYLDDEEYKTELNTFDEFYKFVCSDLSDADLRGFTFDGVDITKIDISEAAIDSSVLISQGLYDAKFYENNIKLTNESTQLIPVEHTEMISIDTFDDEGFGDDSRKLYYISDLHLNHKLKKIFPECATKGEVVFYIRDLVSKLVSFRTSAIANDFLLIGGDVSYNFQIAEIFYKELIKKWDAQKIIVVLGNHDLWNWDDKKTGTADYIIEKYRKLFEGLGINFLQNELFIIKEERSWYLNSVKISENQLYDNSIEWIDEQCKYARLIVFGGIGFSAKNPEFNATHEIYRQTITSFEEDKIRTERFEHIYRKVANALYNCKVVNFTHMPYKDWTTDQPVPNWIYVNGHTHRNEFCLEDKKTVYADNQVGYHNLSMGLKYFVLIKNYDVFKDYSDGIYDVSREDYITFHKGINVNIQFTRDNGKVVMIKKNGLYCFFYESDKGKLYLLKGGTIRTLKEQDLGYYYDTMDVYKLALREVMKEYHAALKIVAREVKRIGGDGKIHGCIIDIDFFNHIYLDPLTGKLIPYSAVSICDRVEYKTVEALLEAEREDLYLTYKQIYLQGGTEIQIFSNKKTKCKTEAMRVLADTSMYKPSNLFRSFQYMFDVNVIREWNEELVCKMIQRYKQKSEILCSKDAPNYLDSEIE